MATRIPDVNKMQRRIPQTVSPAPAIRSSTVGLGISAAAQETRRGASFAAQAEQEEADFQSSQALADLMTFRASLDQRMGESKDWKGMEGEYNKQIDEEISRLSTGLTNPYAKNAFMNRALPLAAEGQAKVAQNAFNVQRDEKRAGVMDRLDKLNKILQTTADPDEAAAVRDSMKGMLHSNPQWFSAEEAGQIDRAFMDEAAKGRIEIAAAKDPRLAIKILGTDIIKNNLDPGEIAQIRSRLEKQAEVKKTDEVRQWALNEVQRQRMAGVSYADQLRFANSISDVEKRNAYVARANEQYQEEQGAKRAQSLAVYEKYEAKLGTKDDTGHVFSIEDIPAEERAQMQPDVHLNMERIYKQRTMKVEPDYNFGMDVYMEQLASKGEWDKMEDIVLHSGSTMPTTQRKQWWNAIKAMQVPPDIQQESDDTQTLIMAYGSTHDGKVLEKDAPELLWMRNELRKWRTEQALVNKRQPSKIERDRFLQQLFIERTYTPPDTEYWHRPPVVEAWHDMSPDERAEYLESLKVKDEELFNTIAAKYVSAGLEPDTLGFILEFESREAAKLMRRPVLKKKKQ